MNIIEVNELMKYMNLSSKDFELLNSYKSQVDFKKIATIFYAKLNSFYYTADILKRNSAIGKMKNIAIRYLESLFSNPAVDEIYLKWREEIGFIHYGIGLNVRWVLGANSLYMNIFFDQIKDRNVLIALEKIMDFDSILIVSFFQREILNQLKHIYDKDVINLQKQVQDYSKCSSYLNDIADEFKMIGINSHIEANKIDSEVSKSFKVISQRIRDIASNMKNMNNDIKDLSDDIIKNINNLGIAFKDYSNLLQDNIKSE